MTVQYSAQYSRRCMITMLAALPMFGGLTDALVAASPEASVDPWPGLKAELFGQRELVESPELKLFAPAQVADAAIVPIDIRLAPTLLPVIIALTVVIDRNPAPVAARFVFTDSYRSGVHPTERVIATRIRLDGFSKVRVVAETWDGRFLTASQFIAGAGGCTSPASKDIDELMATLGRIQVRQSLSTVHDPHWREGVVMIRHPNFTGMQMGNAGAFIPARFVEHVEIRNGNDRLFSVVGGISLSESPYFKFTFDAPDERVLSVEAIDSQGTQMAGRSGS